MLRKLLIEEGKEEAESYSSRLFAMEIWWPVGGTFNRLYPEYEVRDAADRQRFLDFAFLAGHRRVAIELDGFGPHGRDVTRRVFADDRHRQNDLLNDGWLVYRFPTDDLRDRPNLCRQTLLRMFGNLSIRTEMGSGETIARAGIVEPKPLKPVQREIVRMSRSSDVLTVKRVADELGVSCKSASRHLHVLRERGIVEPAFAGAKRVKGYRLTSAYRRSF